LIVNSGRSVQARASTYSVFRSAGGNLTQHFPAEPFCIDCEPPPLVIIKPHSAIDDLFSENLSLRIPELPIYKGFSDLDTIRACVTAASFCFSYS